MRDEQGRTFGLLDDFREPWRLREFIRWCLGVVILAVGVPFVGLVQRLKGRA